MARGTLYGGIGHEGEERVWILAAAKRKGLENFYVFRSGGMHADTSSTNAFINIDVRCAQVPGSTFLSIQASRPFGAPE